MKQWVKFRDCYWRCQPSVRCYIVQTKSPDDVSRVAKEAKAIQGVDNANFGGSDTEILMATMKRVQFWGIIATALLTIVAVLLISNTIRITIMSRATEIQIMRLVGAKIHTFVVPT